MIEAVTVCVDYGDYLKETIIHNRQCFDRWVIVTEPHDKETIELCKAHDVEYLFSKRLHENGEPFAKGKAINEGLAHLDATDWLVHVDADTRMFPLGFKEAIEREEPMDKCALWGVLGRYLIEDKQELRRFESQDSDNAMFTVEDFTHVLWFVGFFQMWHSSYCTRYSEVSHTAGLDDCYFLEFFARRKSLKTYCLHLGPIFMWHSGRPADDDKF